MNSRQQIGSGDTQSNKHTNMQSDNFQQIVRDFYRKQGRHELLWRQAEREGSFDPYKILVSEIMLQQTQVGRVMPKYREFLTEFPDLKRLAAAPFGEVLAAWNGLGYNRRAKFLWQAAQVIVRDFGGKFPREVIELQKLPGVGANTAGAVAAYAFNQPVAFVETNIRTVFIHHFFRDEQDIPDKLILDLVEQTLDRDQPRIWFWSLMDYGSYLKQTIGNLNRASKGYAKQSKFEGSKRQLRGQIIRSLLERPLDKGELNARITDERLASVLEDLVRENLLAEADGVYALYS